MAQFTLQQAFDLALQHHQAGRLREAENLYRQILAYQPKHAEALHHLGMIAHQMGRNDIAVDLIRRAIALRPDYAEAHSNLGNALRANGQLDEAIAAYRHAIILNPNLPEAHSNLGNVLSAKGQLNEAIAAYRQAVALRPSHAEGHGNLGNALKDSGQLDEAIAAYRQAIALRPEYAEAHNNLGNALTAKGQLDEAIAAYRQAISMRPGYAEAHNNLGNALTAKEQLDEAIAAYRQAIALRPGYAEAHNNLGNTLTAKGQLDEAIAAFRQAIALRPGFAEAHSNLGNALTGEGQLDEAIAACRQAIALNPNLPEAHSKLVFTLHFHWAYDAESIAEEHRRWNRQYAEPLRKFIQPHTNNRDPDRRLRIGYVSPDFRKHPVGLFLLPLFRHHDKNQVEVFGYSQAALQDEMTHRLRCCADAWRNITGVSDDQVAKQIREDQIDILVDLTMHTAGNRLLVFARKPAPVQVTYLAYCSTTGLDTIDYRLSDPYLDGPGGDESFYSEKTIRLPETYWCYQPVVDPPQVGPLPALERGVVTFGCLNSFCKVGEPVLQSWAEILQAVPNSRLLLSAHQGGHRQRVQRRMEQDGIDPNRVQFTDFMPFERYFDLYQGIDIALDSFPYGGGTTTCDALWMGVPVVSLVGTTAVGRGGLSILSNIGVPELVARSKEEYVRLASELANDLPRLSDLRSTLRQRMEQSPLMDGPRFARNIEVAYRQMWRTWCETVSTGS
jgi:predicted O-linked N-acetylglucosamine transferase (SPINDLY family)